MSRPPAAGSAAAAAASFCSTRSVIVKSAGRTAWTCSVKRDSVASTPAATPCAASVACWLAWCPVWASSAPVRMTQTPKNRPAAAARAAGHSTTDRTSVRTEPGCFTMTVLMPHHWLRSGSCSRLDAVSPLLQCHVQVTIPRTQPNHCWPSAPDSGSDRIGKSPPAGSSVNVPPLSKTRIRLSEVSLRSSVNTAACGPA